ncbi:MAG: ATP-dependent helicase [Patescibacteria group bacterium]|nr:ATP-dependent helicase [Patescibacteria group bacterium]
MQNREKPSELLNGLNPEQARAVEHLFGPQLIVAGAGTGKTTVITRRIAWLLEQRLAQPTEILALTFTEKAAAEMEERIDRLLPYGMLDVWISTFHAFGQRLLERHALDIGLPVDFKVLTETDAWLLLRRNFEKLELDYYRPLGSPVRFLHALIRHFSRAKDELVTPADYEDYAKSLQLDSDRERGGAAGEAGQEAKRAAEVARSFAVYQKLLVDHGSLDFGDLINYALELFRRRPAILARYRKQFKYIMVDEFQDTNYAQYQLLKLLAGSESNLTVVGDDDQSIYKFRGASVSNILKFKEDHPKAAQVSLVKNYRGRQNLLDLAYDFIQANNPERLEVKLKIDKRLEAQVPGAGVMSLIKYRDYHQEADAVVKRIVEIQKRTACAWSDFAVLLRANDSAEEFTQALARAGIPAIQLSRKGLYRKPAVLDVLAYFRLLDNYHESSAMFRVLSLPLFQFSHDDLARLTSSAHRKAYSIYEALKHPELTRELTSSGQESAGKLLSTIDKHTTLARERSVSELYVTVVHDLGLDKLAAGQSNEAGLSYLDQFYRKVQDFVSAEGASRLRDFMEVVEMEISSGEQGSLDFDPDAGPDAVNIVTVHSAKGLEYRFVFLPGLIDKRFPAIAHGEPIELPGKLVRDILPEGDFHLAEERRLFYVALTRAKEGLFFSYATDYGGASERKPSVFLKELGSALKPEDGAAGKSVPTQPLPQKSGPPKYALPKTHSFTSVAAFKRCALEYKYIYLLKLPRPGSAPLSFGQTIHRTLENYLKFYQQTAGKEQGELFGAKKNSGGAQTLPPLSKLEEFYREAWVDDWFPDKISKETYRKRGMELLQMVHQRFVADPPRPKYLEQNFKLGLSDYVFTGKIDRADNCAAGLRIIDYKTGKHHENLEKADREQLLIYQCAAQEFLKEPVASLEYWYFNDKVEIVKFLGTDKEVEAVKADLVDTMDRIAEAVARDSFAEIHTRQARHTCEFEDLA